MFRKRSILLMKFRDVKPRAPNLQNFSLQAVGLESFHSTSPHGIRSDPMDSQTES